MLRRRYKRVRRSVRRLKPNTKRHIEAATPIFLGTLPILAVLVRMMIWMMYGQ